jgi:hypothetical protein
MVKSATETITRFPTISVAPQAHVAGKPLELDAHRKAFRIQPDFALDATVKLASGTNPFRHRSLGWQWYESVLRPTFDRVEVITVGELLRLGRPHGIGDVEGMEHLRWLFTWGGSYVEIGGHLYSDPPVVQRVIKKVRKRVG